MRKVDAALIPEGECVYEKTRARIRKQAVSFDIRFALGYLLASGGAICLMILRPDYGGCIGCVELHEPRCQ